MIDIKIEKNAPTEHLIRKYLEEHEIATAEDIINYFKMKYIDPPNPVRVRGVLLRMYVKGKIDRRLRNIKGREFIYTIKKDN